MVEFQRRQATLFLKNEMISAYPECSVLNIFILRMKLKNIVNAGQAIVVISRYIDIGRLNPYS